MDIQENKFRILVCIFWFISAKNIDKNQFEPSYLHIRLVNFEKSYEKGGEKVNLGDFGVGIEPLTTPPTHWMHLYNR